MKSKTQKWSDKRDDRTDRIDGVKSTYKDSNLRIILPDVNAHRYNEQVMLLTTANICARWANNIDFQIPEGCPAVLKRFAKRSLKDIVHEIVLLANPDCHLTFNTERRSDQISLSIGNAVVDSDIWIASDGWVAAYGCKRECEISQNPRQSVVGSAFAACLGASELFRIANGEDSTEMRRCFSLYNYRSSENIDDLLNPDFGAGKFDAGLVHQIGCGAIGSSFGFFLSLTEDMSADLHLIDDDHIEPPNTSSSLIFTKAQTDNVTYKVDAVDAYLKGTLINSVPHVEEYAQFINNGKYNRFVPDLILCFANDKGIWSTIQNKFPPLTFHATTNKSWGTNFGRHIPEKEWCIMCRFHGEIQAKFTSVVCSAGNISPEPEKEILGILPFLAPASALIALTEIYKLNTDPNYSDGPSFVEFSMRKATGGFVGSLRGAKQCYVCRDQSLDLYPKYIQDTKYWRLTA